MAFFIRDPKLAQRLPDRLGRHAEPGGALVLIGIGMIAHILRQLFREILAKVGDA